MAFAEGKAAIRIVFDSTKEAAAVNQRSGERRRNSAGLVFIAKPVERAVFIREFVIYADIEISAVRILYGIGDVVVAVAIGVLSGQQGKNLLRQWIDLALRNHVGGQSSACISANRNPAKTRYCAGPRLRQTSIQDF